VFAAIDQATIITIVALLYPPMVAIGRLLMVINRKVNATYKYVDPASDYTNENAGKTLPARVNDLEKHNVEQDNRIKWLESA